jgi:hypothetical protein
MASLDASPDLVVTPQMTLLEIMYRWRATEAVFKAYEGQAGVCLRCQALFDTLEKVAGTYRLDLAALLNDLKTVIRSLPSVAGEAS